VATPDKLRISGEYLQNASLWSDLEVIAKTVLVFLPIQAALQQRLPWKMDDATASVHLLAYAEEDATSADWSVCGTTNGAIRTARVCDL